jgi:hypothetical protein
MTMEGRNASENMEKMNSFKIEIINAKMENVV